MMMPLLKWLHNITKPGLLLCETHCGCAHSRLNLRQTTRIEVLYYNRQFLMSLSMKVTPR